MVQRIKAVKLVCQNFKTLTCQFFYCPTWTQTLDYFINSAFLHSLTSLKSYLWMSSLFFTVQIQFLHKRYISPAPESSYMLNWFWLNSSCSDLQWILVTTSDWDRIFCNCYNRICPLPWMRYFPKHQFSHYNIWYFMHFVNSKIKYTLLTDISRN